MPGLLVELPKRRREDALRLTCALTAKIDLLNSDRPVPLEVLRVARPFVLRQAQAFPPSFFRRLHRVAESLNRQGEPS